jgi:hypothetical protein
MNQALFPASASFAASRPSAHFRPSARMRAAAAAAAAVVPALPVLPSLVEAWARHDETLRLRRLRSLLGLFSLYALVLMLVLAVSDGADVGCILAGIAGHVLYAAQRIVSSWREAAVLEDAKVRTVARLRLRTA